MSTRFMSTRTSLGEVVGTAVAEWDVWTTKARIVVTDRAVLEAAAALVRQRLGEVERAASRFRVDSEVSIISRSKSHAHSVSPMLAGLVEVGLSAAAKSDGAVDPTLGRVMTQLGYGVAGPGSISTAAPTPPTPSVRWTVERRATWRDVSVEANTLRMPAGTLLDLGATAKAWAADRCAEEIAETFGCGALVSLGGDLRVAGSPPADGWNVLVQDGDDEPASLIRLCGVDAVATSSTLHRRWQRNGQPLHHLVDPSTSWPAHPVWRTVTVAAPTCVESNTLTTQAVVRGKAAIRDLVHAGVAARLVDARGEVIRIGGWPP